jgi:hypothetical protein
MQALQIQTYYNIMNISTPPSSPKVSTPTATSTTSVHGMISEIAQRALEFPPSSFASPIKSRSLSDTAP